MREVVLSGDGHMGRFTRPRLRALEALLPGTAAYNCAAGGVDSADLACQAPVFARLQPWAVVVSVGTNDAAPWKAVGLDEFCKNLRSGFIAFGAPVVYVSPPPIDEAAQWDERRRRTNEALIRYERAARDVCDAVGAAYLDTRTLLKPNIDMTSASDFHVEGGVHLNDTGYAVLIPAIASALSADRREDSRAGFGPRDRP